MGQGAYLSSEMVMEQTTDKNMHCEDAGKSAAPTKEKPVEVKRRAETPVDELGRKPADAAEEEAFLRSYKEKMEQREAEKRNGHEAQPKHQPSQKSSKGFLQGSEAGSSTGFLQGSDVTPGRKDMQEDVTLSPASSSKQGWYGNSDMEEKPRETAGTVKLPALVQSKSSPSDLRLHDQAVIEKLQNQLNDERMDRERLKRRCQDLEKKLARSASQPSAGDGKVRFGVSKGAPYKVVPTPPPLPSSPKRTQALMLPALRTIPHEPNTRRATEEKETRASADVDMQRARDKEMTRAQRSEARIEAVKKLETAGMNTWKERKAEKVARLNDLTVFRDSMWGSFFEWHDDYNLT